MTAKVCVLGSGLVLVALVCGGCAQPPPSAGLGGCQGALPNRIELPPESAAEPSSSARSSVMIVIDMSESMRQWAGYDVDGDGTSGAEYRLPVQLQGVLPPAKSKDPDDTRVSAQLAAVE